LFNNHDATKRLAETRLKRETAVLGPFEARQRTNMPYPAHLSPFSTTFISSPHLSLLFICTSYIRDDAKTRTAPFTQFPKNPLLFIYVR